MKRATPVLIALVLSACGTDVSGPSSSLLSCVFGEAATPGAGDAVQVRGSQAVCLAGDGGSEYVYIPFFGARSGGSDDPAVAISVDLTGAGFETPSAALSREDRPLAALAPAGAAQALRYRRDQASHWRLRQREIRELEPLIGPAEAGAAEPALRAATAARVPTVGELQDYNVAVSCTDEDIRTGRVEYVSEHAVVVVDTANPVEIPAVDIEHFAVTFDTLIHPVLTAHFGAPTDIDGNQRSILFFTRAVNERNPVNASSVELGFAWSGDLFPDEDTGRLQGCPAANNAEMFYLVVPDPNGLVGKPFTVEDVRAFSGWLIGHEYQHLINASRRLYVNEANVFERPWLNEGLSHAAEELLFFAVTPDALQPGANLTIEDLRETEGAVDDFNEYMGGNFSNFASYLEKPDTASLMGIDNLTTRGATWAFLRYAADRGGRGDEAFFFDVVNSTVAGLDNLDAVIPDGQPLDWMRDWTVSVYADDFVPGVAARFQASTWNLRSLYEGSNLEQYPLAVATLRSGATTRVRLQAGGAAYYRFGVAADGRATLHAEVDGGAPPSTLRGSFLRVR